MRMQIFGAVLVFMILVSSVVAQEASVPVSKDGDGAVTVEANRVCLLYTSPSPRDS